MNDDELRSKAARILTILRSTNFINSHPITKDLEGLPSHPGIYAVKHKSGEILYVGKGKGLRERLKNGHKAFFWAWIEGIQPSEVAIAFVSLSFEDWLQSLELEVLILQRLRPRYNSQIRQEE